MPRQSVYIYILMCLFLLPGWVVAAPDGEQLFLQHCSACHGSAGNGGVGVPLALPAFQNSVDDQFLIKTVQLGRPGRVMPGFPFLKEQEVQAIVKHIRSWVDGKPPVFDKTRIKGDVKRGKQLYGKHCAACHGANGEGGHGTGVTFSRPRDLPIIAPSLNNSGFLTAASDQLIRKTLLEGRKGTPMLSAAERGLTEQDVNDVVAFVRSFDGKGMHDHIDLASEPLSMEYESPFDFDKTVEKVKQAVIGMNFRIIREQWLEEGLVEKGKENPKQLMVYFCNFELLNDALAVDPRVGLFLPCRVTIIEEKGKVKLVAVNPKRLSGLFNNNELDILCEGMYDTYTEIMEEATL